MRVFYNEIDPYPAQWLRNLSEAKHIPSGVVCERSIADLSAQNVISFDQCHFFAGIGGWSHALRLAGWPDTASVWTGSCPCQPFSVAGRKAGADDKRHLWPEWFRLIHQCLPDVIFGEQVAGRDGLAWLDAVSADLEGIGYAVGSAVLCAAGVGAPHVRSRIYFAAYSDGAGRQRLEPREDSGIAGPWGRFGKEDLQGLYDAPTERGNMWPRPIVRRVDDGIPKRVERLRAYGNAIVPQVAAQFVKAFMGVS